MEDKLISKLIKKEMRILEEHKVPPSVEAKLNKAYEIIKNNDVDIKEDILTIKNKKKANKKKYVMAATFTLCLLALASFNPVLAEKIPVLKEMSHYLKNIYWFNDNYISNANEINITQKDQGIEINLQGVIYDESSIKFIYTLSSDKKLQWGVQMRNSSLKINGKELLISDGKDIGDKRRFSDETKISKDGDEIEKYAAVITYDVSDINLEDNVEINWEPKEIHTFDGVYTNGNWKFNFKISKEALKSTSKVINLGYVFEKDGYKKTIEKIIFTPSETKIIEEDDGKLNQDSFNVRMSLEKDPNNKELKERLDKLEQIDRDLMLFRYRITDEKGNELKTLMGKGQGDLNGSRSMNIYQPVKDIPKMLTFTLLTQDCDKVTEITLGEIKTPFEFRQGDNMSLTVNSIENNNGKIKINATFNGDYIATRVYGGIMVVSPNLDEANGLYGVEKEINKNNVYDYYLKADKENSTFDYYFETDPSQKYVIRFNGEYVKLDEFSIDLSK